MNDCIFCKIIKGEIPAKKIYEDENTLAFLDINPIGNGHTLIIPKKHILDFDTISDEEINYVMCSARKVAKLLVLKLSASGYTLMENNGISQDVKHFHLHIIPKYNNNKKISVDDVYKKITADE